MYMPNFRTAPFQELLTFVVLAVVKQGAPSINSQPDKDGNVVCEYRAENGNKCAFGHLISDDEYQIAMEGYKASHAAKEFLNATRLSNDRLDFLNRLQHCHDRAADHHLSKGVSFVGEFIRNCDILATRHYLEMPKEIDHVRINDCL